MDPQIIKSIQKVTATGVVHKKDDVPIHEEDQNQEESRNKGKSKKKFKEKIQQLNDLAKENRLDIFFVFEKERDQLLIKVFDAHTDMCIKTFGEEDIEELLDRLQNLSGIIVDTKR